MLLSNQTTGKMKFDTCYITNNHITLNLIEKLLIIYTLRYNSARYYLPEEFYVMATCHIDGVEKSEELDDVIPQRDGKQVKALPLKSCHVGVPAHCWTCSSAQAIRANIECPVTYCRRLISILLATLPWNDKNCCIGNIVDRRQVSLSKCNTYTVICKCFN